MTDRLSPAEKRQARETYLSDPNLSVDALAASYGVGRSVMLRVLNGITRRRGGREKATLTTEQMVTLWNNGIGLTLYEIGKQAGVTEQAVHYRIKKYNERKVG